MMQQEPNSTFKADKLRQPQFAAIDNQSNSCFDAQEYFCLTLNILFIKYLF